MGFEELLCASRLQRTERSGGGGGQRRCQRQPKRGFNDEGASLPPWLVCRAEGSLHPTVAAERPECSKWALSKSLLLFYLPVYGSKAAG